MMIKKLQALQQDLLETQANLFMLKEQEMAIRNQILILQKIMIEEESIASVKQNIIALQEKLKVLKADAASKENNKK